MYRPLTIPTTWAAGAVSEQFKDCQLDMSPAPNTKGLLTSNGSISFFVSNLMQELKYERVPSGGAGNKMLMLLEGKGAAYIQDRGVSRWDTSGAQAVLEAHGGILAKLTSFIDKKEIQSYTYLKSSMNLDFESGVACLTPYNAADKASIKKGESVKAVDVGDVQPYANLCGLLALDCNSMQLTDEIYDAMLSAKEVAPPSFD